jgi:hypothetical protein
MCSRAVAATGAEQPEDDAAMLVVWRADEAVTALGVTRSGLDVVERVVA